jgi:hypothetical protein
MEELPGLHEALSPFGFGPYLLCCPIDADTVAIARVWHGREERESPLQGCR